jgi:pimeloyl-ACP methyl ester carboxylesterase
VRLLGVGPVVVAGYSMGGPISLLLWHRHPELVAGLVLEATALEWRAKASDRARWWGLVALEFFLRSRVSRWWNRKTVRKMADGNPILEEHLDWITAEARRGDPGAITEAGRALAQYDARAFASGVDVPAAVVLTTEDKLVKPRRQQALARATHAAIVELHGDHFAHWAVADDFAKATVAAVDAVVSRVPAPA